MKDSTSEREHRIRELLARKENMNELGVLSQGQAEIQNIQSELANHIAMQRVQDQARLQNTGVLSQAAEGLLAIDGGGGQTVQQQVGQMNPSTQAIMQKYGIKPENSRKMTSQNSRSISGAGTTNIRTENITNNRTEIKITQPQIPIAQPQIRVSAPQKTDNTAKFKTWLNNMFAKQQNDAEIQKKEYRKKEWNLARTTTKLMKKIESSAKNMTSRLDPARFTSTLGGQLRWLLLLFGATIITKVWKPTLKFLANFEAGFRAVFGLPIDADLKRGGAKGVSIIDKIKEFIGIKDKDTSLIKGIGTVFMQGINKLIDKLEFWFNDRAAAIREIKFPEIKGNFNVPTIPGLGSVMEGISDTLKGIGQYIGDIITVALGGSKGRVRAEANRIRSKSTETYQDTRGKSVSAGDDALMQGSGRDYMRGSDFGAGGILKGNASSTQAMSRTVGSLINDNSNTAHTAEIASGVQQLFDVAKRNGQVVIDPAFLSSLGFNQIDLNQLRASKGLIPVEYKLIQKRLTDEDLKDADRYTTFNSTGAGLTGAGIGGWTGLKAGAALGSFAGPVGTVIGGGIGLAGGALTGGIIGYGVGDTVDDKINSWKKNGFKAKLVPIDSTETSDDGSPAIRKQMFALTKEGANAVAAKLMSGAKDQSIDLANKEFYERIKRIEEQRKRSNGVRGSLRQNIGTNSLEVAQADYERYKAEWYNKFESLDPNSENMKNYYAWNTTTGNISQAFTNAANWAGEQVRSIGNSVSGGSKRAQYYSLKDPALKQRIDHCIKYFMDHGLTKAQAVGIVANLTNEGLFVKDLGAEYKDVNGPSAGIAGFHDVTEGKNAGPGHLTALKKFASERGLNWKDLDTQLDYLMNGTLNGQRIGGDTIDKIKSLTGTEEEVARESSFIWGRDYERFAGKTVINGKRVGYKYRDDPEHIKRGNYAEGLLKSYDPNNTAVTKVESIQKPIMTLSEGVGGTTEIKEGGTYRVIWIGDSQSVTQGCAFPRGVANGLQEPIAYYGMVGANPSSYLGAKLSMDTGSNLRNLKGKSCNEALSVLLQEKPEYCIIALGHNGTIHLQNLINVIKEAGVSKVVVIKMWAIKAAEGTGMASYDEEAMSKMYDGASADAWVDLTWMDIEKQQDGVHASSRGCADAASEVVYQLKTGTRSRKAEGPEEGSILDDARDMVGGLMNSVAGVFSPVYQKEGIDLGSPTSGMTLEQKKAFENAVGRVQNENEFNSATWINQYGAKVDSMGTYVDSKNDVTGETTRVYLRTDDNHNALKGLSAEDVRWVEVYDKEGKRKEISDKESEVSMRGALLNMNTLFYDYPEKDGINDGMKDNKGNNIFFYLGEFNDLSGFHEVAKKDFGGKIKFSICPSKDGKRINMISICSKVRCSMPFTTQGYFLNDAERDEVTFKGEKAEDKFRYYGFGPSAIIYKKGIKWRRWGTKPSDNVYIEWQPLCEYLGVQLTPRASEIAERVLNFLAMNKGLTRVGENRYQRADGSILTQEEVEFAKKHGMISYNGVIDNKFIQADQLNMHKSGVSILPNHTKEMIEKVFGKTKEEREAYYKAHEKDFRRVGNDLYEGGSKIKFGEYNEKGNLTFFDDGKFNSLITKTELEENDKKIRSQETEDLANSAGMISREFLADYLYKTANYNKKATILTRETSTGIPGEFVINVDGNPKKISFFAFHSSTGTFYKINKAKTEVAISGLEDSRRFKSLDELKSFVLNSLNDTKDGKFHAAFPKDHTGNSRQALFDKLAKELVNNGIEVDHPDKWRGSSRTWYLKDGTTFETSERIPSDLPPGFVANVNQAISHRQKQVREYESTQAYEKSELKRQYDSLVDKANKTGEFRESGGYAITASGDAYGIIDKDKEGKTVVRKFTAKEANEAALNTINNDEYTRSRFYRRAFGLKSMGYGDQNGFYKEIELDGKKYYAKVDTNTDLRAFQEGGWNAITNGGQIFSKDAEGRFNPVEDEKIKTEINKGIQQMVDFQGLTKDAINSLAEGTEQQAEKAAEQRKNQALQQIEQTRQSELSNLYLKTIAENIDSEAIKKGESEINSKANQQSQAVIDEFNKYSDQSNGSSTSSFKVDTVKDQKSSIPKLFSDNPQEKPGQDGTGSGVLKPEYQNQGKNIMGSFNTNNYYINNGSDGVASWGNGQNNNIPHRDGSSNVSGRSTDKGVSITGAQ